ncbi:MAG: AAA family ATPase [Candidatus Sungbacteria bacterium]|nr:AAA family ATPase [Candidatus Sungbacteria bacterium]
MADDIEGRWGSDNFLDALGLSHLKSVLGRRRGQASEMNPATSRGYEEALEAARKKIREQGIELQRLSSHPFDYATVITVNPGELSAVIIHEGRVREVALPTGKNILPGDTVKISSATMQIIAQAAQIPAGNVGILRRVGTEASEIDYQGVTKVVLNGKCAGSLETGDRVRLDQHGFVITAKLEREEERYRFSEETHVQWSDIGGCDDAKELLIEAIELPHEFPELFSAYNKKPPKGILLYGPPGCGKTMLAKAAATALAETHRKKDGPAGNIPSGFFFIKGPELLDKYVGATEAKIREVFDLARRHEAKYGYQPVIFFDEADALLSKRGSGISSDMERTIVPMFLSEMDGLQKAGAIVLLATNRPDVLDPAVIREGRIDRKVKIPRPTKEVSVVIFELHLKGVPFANKDITHELVSQFAADALFSDERVLYDLLLNPADQEKKAVFALRELVNGAMIKGAVDKATSIALNRDRKAGNKTATGITKEDITAAIDSAFRENFDMNHDDELEEFRREHGGGIPLKRVQARV